MKYTVEIIIDRPRDEVIKTLRNVDESFKWMEGLTKFDLIEGKNEEVGSVYLMEFTRNGKTSSMTETIKEFNPPEKMTMVYEAGGVWNETINRFEKMGDKTKYYMDNTFVFKFPLKLILPLFPKMFRKETLKGMTALKDYMESKNNK